METPSSAKSIRLLEIYARLVSGEVLDKDLLAAEYHVSDRSIQRDMNSLRCFLSDQGLPQELTYDYQNQGYKLVFDAYITSRRWEDYPRKKPPVPRHTPSSLWRS